MYNHTHVYTQNTYLYIIYIYATYSSRHLFRSALIARLRSSTGDVCHQRLGLWAPRDRHHLDGGWENMGKHGKTWENMGKAMDLSINSIHEDPSQMKNHQH